MITTSNAAMTEAMRAHVACTSRRQRHRYVRLLGRGRWPHQNGQVIRIW